VSEKANQFRIGLFVVVGVALVLAALFLFGIREALQPKDAFETYVTGEVEGLAVGSVVELRGVAVGKVTQIGFSWNLYQVGQPTCVVVRCNVTQRIIPPSFRQDFEAEMQKIVDGGLRAVIQTNGITGSSIVALQNMDPKLYPPLKVPWKPKYFYVPSAPSQLGRLLASVDRTLANLEKLDIGRLSKSLDNTLVSADGALRRLSELDVHGISNNANRMLLDASSAINEVKGLVTDARADIEGMKLQSLGQDTGKLVNDVDARMTILLEKLSGIDVNALNDTLAGTREAARNLNEAIEELKKYPSGFLLGGPPPPATGLQKEKK